MQYVCFVYSLHSRYFYFVIQVIMKLYFQLPLVQMVDSWQVVQVIQLFDYGISALRRHYTLVQV